MTQPPPGITFGPYRLDPVAARLWKGNDPIPLQPRPLAVLSYLAIRRGELVGRDELISHLWAGTHVTKAVLKVAVRAVREALGEEADAPRYIETVGREGYRFVADGNARAKPAAARESDAAPPIVGRDADIGAMHAALERALHGDRVVLFVTGEAGIGKTTLIGSFLHDVERNGAASIAHGQCLEQYGEGEPYLPVLEAIGRLAREDGATELRGVLRRHAPTWTSRLPAVDAPASTAARRRATTTARMLREMADALEVFTRRRGLVLVLEDLQWSDRSTVDLLAYLARRTQPARLLVVASLRPADAIVHQHPIRVVKQELHAAGRCDELALELLSLADVTAYVRARFHGAIDGELRHLGARVYDRTDGNALFMVNVVNDLVARGSVTAHDGQWRVGDDVARALDHVPLGVQDLIGRRLHDLAPGERRVLEVASVAGDEFAVGAVAAALQATPDEIDDVCESLAARASFIGDAGVADWPDGSVSGRYRFLHALYRHVLYESIAASRRIRLHRAIGLCLEAAFGTDGTENAAELAMHFERGRDDVRALAYHERAGAAALEQHAAHEAVRHFEAALAVLPHVDDATRAERELRLAVTVATLLMATKGYAAPDTERAFARARACCDTAPSAKADPVLRGVVSYHHVRAELDEALALGEKLLRRAGVSSAARPLRIQAHYAHGATLFHAGRLVEARAHLEAALAEYDPVAHREHVLAYGGYDPGVACLLWLAWTLVLGGDLAAGEARDRDGLALARRLGDPFSLAWACHAAGVTQQLFGDWAASERVSTEAARLADEHGFPHVLGMATVNRGWARLMQGDVPAGARLVREGVTIVDATGARLVRPQYLGMLAAADLMEGNVEAAVRGFDEALAEVARTGERIHETGLLIGKSHLLAAVGRSRARRDEDGAEGCLRRAVALAREQGARLMELRAALALARSSERQGRVSEARAIVVEAYAPFAAGPATAPEVAAARELLAVTR